MLNFNDYITNNPDLFKQYKVDDLLFVEYVCLVQDELINFWAPNNYFVYTLKGKKGIKTLDKEYILKEGDAMFVKKGGQTTLQFFEDQYLALLIFLPDEFIKGVMQENQAADSTPVNETFRPTIYTLEVDDILSTYFYSLLSHFSRSQPPSRQLLKNKFEELILNILSGPNNQRLASYFNHLHANSKLSIPEIMEANFPYNLKMEEFARLAGRSLSTFRRDFEKTYGISPLKWLTKRRLEYAKYLLETTDKTINEITYSIGFENPSHFIRIFKENFEVSPFKFKQAT